MLLKRRAATLSVVCLVAFVAWTGGAGAAGRVACGDVVTTSLTLTEDLLDCPANGLVIGADHVTLDLAGHTVGGTGAGTGIVMAGSDVRVTNGSVRGFTDGILAQGGFRFTDWLDGVEVSRMAVSGNSATGIGAFNVRNAGIRHNAVTQNHGLGVRTFWLFDGVVGDNAVVGNGAGGISARETGGALTRNRVLRNGGAGIAVSDPYALDITGNRADGNAGDGITTFQNYPGYQLVVLAGNTANRNAGYGIRAWPQEWITPPGLPTDGGGNSAHLNGGAAQCLSIQCARSPGQAR